MNIALKKLQKYCEQNSTQQSEVLHRLERETHLKTLAPQMMSGQLQGQLLSFISQMQQPKYILEIGTFTGYAAICLAKGLQADGEMHCIEAKEELGYIIRKYFAEAGIDKQSTLHIGDAKKLVPTLNHPWDLVFLDAGKKDYTLYFDLIIDQVASGGIILADNVLWSGKVTQERYDNDTKVIHDFNKKILDDPRVENVILPMRDGISIIRKR